MTITVSKLVNPILVGDWHDKPLKWTVVGPEKEVQNFSTKANAKTYASIRKNSEDRVAALKEYARR